MDTQKQESMTMSNIVYERQDGKYLIEEVQHHHGRKTKNKCWDVYVDGYGYKHFCEEDFKKDLKELVKYLDEEYSLTRKTK